MGLDTTRMNKVEDVQMFPPYDKMNDSERREFMAVLLDNVQIYEERQPNGQWFFCRGQISEE